jgi:RNA polymerase sigma-70 factor (ECF subfamily)
MDVDARSDRELLTAVRRGEADAVAVLYRRHESWLLTRLSGRAPDTDMVHEVINDTFLAVWRGASHYRGDGSVAGWIWGIALRRLIDHFRGQSPPMAPLTETAAGTVPSAEDEVLRGIEHSPLGTALTSLRPELRHVVQAVVLEGLTSTEAGRRLGIPAGTVKTRMMRARRLLAERVAEHSTTQHHTHKVLRKRQPLQDRTSPARRLAIRTSAHRGCSRPPSRAASATAHGAPTTGRDLRAAARRRLVHRPVAPPGQGGRQRSGQPGPVGQQPQQHRPGGWSYSSDGYSGRACW